MRVLVRLKSPNHSSTPTRTVLQFQLHNHHRLSGDLCAAAAGQWTANNDSPPLSPPPRPSSIPPPLLTPQPTALRRAPLTKCAPPLKCQRKEGEPQPTANSSPAPRSRLQAGHPNLARRLNALSRKSMLHQPPPQQLCRPGRNCVGAAVRLTAKRRLTIRTL